MIIGVGICNNIDAAYVDKLIMYRIMILCSINIQVSKWLYDSEFGLKLLHNF